MLSDELQSKPELLVEFVQNASIPLGEGLVGTESKDLTCLSLLPEPSECGSLLLPEAPGAQRMPSKGPGAGLLNSLQVDIDPNSDTREDKSGVLLSPSEPSSLLQDLPANDNSSFILLNLARSGLGSPSEHLVFVEDDAEDSGNDFLSNDCTDSSTPWFLRVQELAHDSLIAATRAQLAKSAKSSSNADTSLNNSPEADPKAAHKEKRLRCSFHGCDRSFVSPTHLKYHLKTHRNDRSFTCPAEGCGKSFYVLQRLKVHMRTHNGERPFLCSEPGCGKQFTTAGNLKNHLRIHTGEKPFLCETEGCGRSFAEYSSLRKHLVVHSGVKSHQCPVCGKNYSQSGSRNAHVRKHHSRRTEAISISFRCPGIRDAPHCGNNCTWCREQICVVSRGNTNETTLPDIKSGLTSMEGSQKDHSSAAEHLHLSEDALEGSHLLSVAAGRHSYEEVVSILLN